MCLCQFSQAGDLRSQIEKLLDTPASTAPVGAYIKAVTGEGPNQKVVNIPILEGDKNSTIRRILEHLRLTLPKITDIKLIPHVRRYCIVVETSLCNFQFCKPHSTEAAERKSIFVWFILCVVDVRPRDH